MDYAFGIRYHYFHNLKPWRGSLVFCSRSSVYILFLFCDLLRYFSIRCGIEITSAG